MLLSLTSEKDISFSDVKESDWLYRHIKRAAAAGYITGYEDNTIKANAEITRSEVCVLVSKILNLPQAPGSIAKFADAPAIPAWALPYIESVIASGFMGGYPDGTFGYARNETRAEAVSLISSAMNRSESKFSSLQGNAQTSGDVTVFVTDPTGSFSNLLESRNPDGSKTIYVYGVGLISQERVTAGATGKATKATPENATEYRLFHYDYRGSTTMLTDADGNVTDRVVYSPYGKIDERTGETETRFLYVGQFGVQVDENGLYYMRARYYNVDINRFMQEDPIRDGLNWYVYCINNPVAFVDPFGLEKIVVSGGVYHPKEGKKYQYEFIDTALNQINSWVHDRWSRELKNDEKVTWFIAKAGWTDDDFKNFSKAADRENVEVIGFDDVDELISYINDGSFNNRLDDPITNFVVFSHGLANDNGIVSFGYNYTSSYNQNLNMDTSDISKIRSSAFSDNSLTRFYSCNTGTSMDNSFAQVWANTTGSETIGAVGKTEYTYINKSGFWDFLADQVYKISRSIVTGSEDPWVYPFQSYELPEVDRSAYWVTFKPQ